MVEYFTSLQALFATANNSSTIPFNDKVDVLTSKKNWHEFWALPMKKEKDDTSKKHQKTEQAMSFLLLSGPLHLTVLKTQPKVESLG